MSVMIRLGLCSGACITRDIEGVIATASAAGLDAVEWAADAHITAGDLRAAQVAMLATLTAGLTIASYATLYRAGSADADFKHFDALLGTASMLQAPLMRMFALATSQDGAIVDDLLRLGDRAAKKGIRLCLSMGRGTSLDGYRQVARIAKGVKHDFIRLAWEDLPGSEADEASAALEGAGAFAGLLVARSAGRDGKPRALADEQEAWRRRIAAFKRAEMDPKMGSFILLGAVRDEGSAGDESLATDVKTLRALIAEV